MSQHTSKQDREVAVQREVTRIALAGVDGFALAGSGAIREHGMSRGWNCRPAARG